MFNLPSLPKLTGHKSRGLAKPKPPRSRGGFKFTALPSKQERLEAKAAEPPGTLPERLVKAWLEKQSLPWQSQQSEMGGRLRVGGAIVDFIIYVGTPPGVVLRVQGDYWHSMEPRRSRDRTQRERLIAKGYRVVDLWEGDIYNAVLGGYLARYMRKKLFGAG